jgi:hypothetical protein
MEQIQVVRLLLGVGFLIANLRVLYQLGRFFRLRSSAILTWPSPAPPFYRLMVAVGGVLALLILYKVLFLQYGPLAIFTETMMLVYFGYAMPVSVKIARGFYEEGVWAEGGFLRYADIGGLTWREGERVTLVMMPRMRSVVRRLHVPDPYYGAARRLLRDKIAARDIHLAVTPLDLGTRDATEDV